MAERRARNKNVPALEPPLPEQEGSLGVFTVVALLLLLWGFFWLKGSDPFRPTQKVNVIFHNVDGLAERANVVVDGMRAGFVDKLEWLSPHKVLVRLSINRARVVVPQGSKFAIYTNGLVGAKYVEIILPSMRPDEPHPPPLNPSQEIEGQDPLRTELLVTKVAELVKKSVPVLEHALPVENKVCILTDELKSTTQRFGRLLDNPRICNEFRDTVEKVRDTVDHLQCAMRELDRTITDKTLRRDIRDTFERVYSSAQKLEETVEMLHDLAGDKTVRADLKQILSGVRKDVDRVSDLMNKPLLGGDVRQILDEARTTACDFDMVALQLQQMLDKKHPLLRMIFGRPGHLPVPMTQSIVITREKPAQDPKSSSAP
jgi:phospholipid/cholesterol/gamma-HCH transport system substrate-binding protein